MKKSNRQKLTDENVLAIRVMLKDKVIITKIAKKFKVCPATISNIKNFKVHNEVKEIEDNV